MSRTTAVAGSAPRAVLAQLADGARLTAAEISARTGIPRSTVVQALRRLAAAGEVSRHDVGPRGRGRPAAAWSVAAAPGPLAVVVATAHGTVVGVVAPDGAVLAAREAEPLEAAGEGRRAGPALDALDDALAACAVAPGDLSMAVVGLPGPSEFGAAARRAAAASSGHLRRFRTWDGGSPAERLAAHLGCPVHTENDANLAALGEATSGAGAGRDSVLHVSLAHGTGAGLVLGGRLHRGAAGLAGEIGHLHQTDDGPLCHCGAQGCFWQVQSVPALLRALAEAHGRPFTAADVARAAADDDQDVVGALVGFGHALGRRLADAVVLLNPEAIVVDGGLGAASDVVARGVREGVRRYAPPTLARATEVLVGTCGETAALVGAAALARTEGLFARASGG